MSKFKIIIVYSCATLLLSGCGAVSETYSIVSRQDSVVSRLEDDIMEIDYKKTTAIRINPPVDNMYMDSIDIEITKEYVDEFIRCADNVETYEEPFESEPWYSIKIMSNEGIMDNWRVDCSGVITTCTGTKLKRSGDIDSLLSKLETEYSISMNILSSTPGINYFGLMNEVESIIIYKNTQSFMSESSNISVNLDNVTTIKNILSKCEIESSIAGLSNTPYSLVLYGKNEEPLYKLLIDDAGEIYTSYGYKIKSPYLKSVIDSALRQNE